MKQLNDNGLRCIAAAMIWRAVKDARNKHDLILRDEARWWLCLYGVRMAETLWPDLEIPDEWRKPPSAVFQYQLWEITHE